LRGRASSQASSPLRSMSAEPPTLALDIGGTKMAAALVQHGQVVWRAEEATPDVRAPEHLVAAAMALVEDTLSTNPARLGVAMTGRVVDGKTYPLNQTTLPGWTGFDLRAALSERTALPTTVLNDACAAAWGEYLYGSGRGVREFLFVTVSTGIGGGLVLGGRLHLAANGLEAELGFTHTDKGPLEYVASGRALDHAAAARGWGRAEVLATRAEAGDADADALYTQSAALVAAKLADVAALLGVTRIALGGSVGLRRGYLTRVQDALAAFPEVVRPEIVHAALGKDAGLLGAAAWAGMTFQSSECRP